jgi:N,N'-diacetyllegionaminate synthase
MSAFNDKILELKRQNKIYVIAEVGSNARDENQLVDSVMRAKKCGADAVKFQYFDESELFGPVSKIRKDNPLGRLKVKADAVGIDLICSSFSPEGMREIDPFVVAHKIASSEMSHIRLLETAKSLGKPVILSTGAYFLTDIERVVTFMRSTELVLLHCNVSYPTKFVDMAKYVQLEKLGLPLGYSDHTTSIDAVPMFFASAGAVVYEKHFNPFNLTDTPDAAHSLNMEEFKAMVDVLRGNAPAYTEENEARLKHVRRVVATKDINIGDVLTEGANMGIFRARESDASGANPFFIDRLEGKKATKQVKAGRGISPLDAR